MPIPISYARLPGPLRRLLDVKGDYRRTFTETVHGRRVLADLLDKCGMDHSHEPFVAGAPDLTNANLGKQAIGRHILTLLNITDAEVIRLATRNRKEKEDPDYVPDRYESD